MEDATTDTNQIEDALKDTIDAAPALPRCDCPALDVPHVHAQSGPVALPGESV